MVPDARERTVRRSTNSLNVALPPLLAPHRRLLSAATGLFFFVVTLASGGHASAADYEVVARALFTRFVAAQNAHNADEVKAMLWNSPNMLLFSRGVETRGPGAVAVRFKQYYEGSWHLEPDMSQFHVATISSDVVQILVPIVFTRGLRGNPPKADTFLISQTFVRDETGWHVASILPIANTQLK